MKTIHDVEVLNGSIEEIKRAFMRTILAFKKVSPSIDDLDRRFRPTFVALAPTIVAFKELRLRNARTIHRMVQVGRHDEPPIASRIQVILAFEKNLAGLVRDNLVVVRDHPPFVELVPSLEETR